MPDSPPPVHPCPFVPQVSAILAFIMATPFMFMMRYVTKSFITAPLLPPAPREEGAESGIAGDEIQDGVTGETTRAERASDAPPR